MKNNFINEMDTSRVTRYVKPPLITLSGAPGSGKTELARELSRQLGVFLLSNDYVRNAYLKTVSSDLNSEEERLRIQSYIKRINLERMLKLLIGRVPFVYDADLNTFRDNKKFELLAKFFRFELIRIRLSSSGDKENLRRIQGRVLDLEDRDMSVIGDNMRYSGPYDESAYNQILLRKPDILSTTFFDYHIFNIKDLDFFLEQINAVVEDINTMRLTKL